eukprot:3940659-Rhodomonas_salina.4
MSGTDTPYNLIPPDECPVLTERSVLSPYELATPCPVLTPHLPTPCPLLPCPPLHAKSATDLACGPIGAVQTEVENGFRYGPTRYFPTQLLCAIRYHPTHFLRMSGMALCRRLVLTARMMLRRFEYDLGPRLDLSGFYYQIADVSSAISYAHAT